MPSVLVLQVVAVILGLISAGSLGVKVLMSRHGIHSVRTWAGAGALIACALMAAWILYHLLLPCAPRTCQLTRTVESAQVRTALLDRDGREVALFERDTHEWVPLEHIPEHVVSAVLQREDRRYYAHRGVDFIGVLRALRTVPSAERIEGASTIAMQTTRCVVGEEGSNRVPPKSHRPWGRKVAEVAIAGSLIQRFGHDQILEIYLNCVPMGPVQGLPAAAERFFGRQIDEISIEQALALAAMIRAPSRMNPFRHLDDLTAETTRFAKTLSDREVLPRPVIQRLKRQEGLSPGRAQYSFNPFTDPVELVRAKHPHVDSAAVRTTVDSGLHVKAWEETQRLLQHASGAGPNGAHSARAAFLAMTLDGRVRAYVNARPSPRRGDLDLIRHGQVLLASTIKPLLAASAFEAGVAEPGTRVESLSCPDPRSSSYLQQHWTTTSETLSLREALARSDNWAAICLLNSGVGEHADHFSRVNLDNPDPSDASQALGTQSIRPIDLARAYASLISGKEPAELQLLEKSEPDEASRSNGDEESWIGWMARRVGQWVKRVIDGSQPERVWSSSTVKATTSVLEAVIEKGTGQAAAPLQDRAATGLKTGTVLRAGGVQEMLVVGFTETEEGPMVGLLWLGNERPRSLGLRGGAGTHLVPAWSRIMKEAL